MQLAHVNKRLMPTLKVLRDDSRAAKMMQRWQQRDFDVAVSENMDAIKELQKREPGWMPKFK